MSGVEEEFPYEFTTTFKGAEQYYRAFISIVETLGCGKIKITDDIHHCYEYDEDEKEVVPYDTPEKYVPTKEIKFFVEVEGCDSLVRFNDHYRYTELFVTTIKFKTNEDRFLGKLCMDKNENNKAL